LVDGIIIGIHPNFYSKYGVGGTNPVPPDFMLLSMMHAYATDVMTTNGNQNLLLFIVGIHTVSFGRTPQQQQHSQTPSIETIFLRCGQIFVQRIYFDCCCSLHYLGDVECLN